MDTDTAPEDAGEIERLIEVVRTSGRNEERMAAVERLAGKGSRAHGAIAVLVEAAVASSAPLRAAALKALESIDAMWPETEGAVGATDRLVRVLRRPNGPSASLRGMRAAAMKVCAEIGQPAAKRLAEELGDDCDDVATMYMLRALGRMGGSVLSGHLDAIAGKLSASNPNVAEEAALTLTKVEEPSRTVPPLTEALDSRWGPVRKEAARCLGNVGAGALSSTETLIRSLYDADADVRKAAGEALPKIGPEAIPFVLRFIAERMETIRRTVERQSDESPALLGSAKDLAELRVTQLQRLAATLNWEERARINEYERLEDAYAKAVVIVARLEGESEGTRWRPSIDALIQDASGAQDERFVRAAMKARALLEPT